MSDMRCLEELVGRALESPGGIRHQLNGIALGADFVIKWVQRARSHHSSIAPSTPADPMPSIPDSSPKAQKLISSPVKPVTFNVASLKRRLASLPERPRPGKKCNTGKDNKQSETRSKNAST
ncbi:hypothetical protein V8E54_007396 [Elaphomyces granulatus]